MNTKNGLRIEVITRCGGLRKPADSSRVFFRKFEDGATAVRGVVARYRRDFGLKIAAGGGTIRAIDSLSALCVSAKIMLQTDELFGPDEFAEFLAVLRRAGDVSRWNEALARITTAVRRAIRRRFSDVDLSAEAVQSACRTLLGRLQRGRYQFNGPDALTALLVMIAYRKALKLARASATIKVDPHSLPYNDAATPLVRQSDSLTSTLLTIDPAVLRKFLAEQLEEVLRQVGDHLRKPTHRKILACWLENETAVQLDANGAVRLPDESSHGPLNQVALASKCGCSVRTLRDVIKGIETVWEPLIAEAREFFIEFLASQNLLDRPDAECP